MVNYVICKCTNEKLQDDVEFAKTIIFADEAHFDLGGCINKHSCRIWDSKNQYVVLQKPMQPLRVIVWCGL